MDRLESRQRDHARHSTGEHVVGANVDPLAGARLVGRVGAVRSEERRDQAAGAHELAFSCRTCPEFRRRCRVHRWSVFPGHLTKHMRLPRLWQILVLVSAKG